VLTAASLMVSGPAAADAVARARRLPTLRVGLHLVLVDGVPTLPPGRIPDLVDRRGHLRCDMAALGAAVFLRPGVRAQVAAEIDAQFDAFRHTGLVLDHVNAHHHFHLHPTIAREVVVIGRRYGMKALRVPGEPSRLIRAMEPRGAHRRDWRVAPWVASLRRRVAAQRLSSARQVFGLAWSGAMTEARLSAILRNLPDGLSEIYLHPATANDFPGASPGMRYTDELAALLSPQVAALVNGAGVPAGGFADFHRA
jgi:hopanoid biosynthesis associated protein HpnK